MITNLENFNIDYDQMMSEFDEDPDNVAFKHKAVLALARAGATAYALSEFKRMELNKVDNNEDVMALGARLLKDLYLSQPGNKALGYARESAEQYKTAYEKTGGYYSGINAATMSFLADLDDEFIEKRVLRVLEDLPGQMDTNPETKYYIEATRAEAHYLLGEIKESRAALRRAVDHDPLNYAAHATTLKQFAMIAKKRRDETIWTKPFQPPKAVHYAGHLFAEAVNAPANLPNLNQTQINALTNSIADTIQRNDIGYGYGALAAGSDILIAESLLAEGCELHVFLPVPEKIFIAGSVAPYGEIWVKRFNKCKRKASSFRVQSNETKWPCSKTDGYSSRIAMGSAILHGNYLSDAVQILIWDEVVDRSATAHNARDWVSSKNAKNQSQYVIPYSGIRSVKKLAAKSDESKFKISSATSKSDSVIVHDNFESACATAIENCEQQVSISQGLHIELAVCEKDSPNAVKSLAQLALPGSIFVSEAFAAHLAVSGNQNYRTELLGNTENNIRIYALQVGKL